MEFEKLVDEVLKELLKRLQFQDLCSIPSSDHELPDSHKAISKEFDLSKKKLLTEQVLEEFSLKNRSYLLVNHKCIITPLAMDYIRDREITIRYVHDTDKAILGRQVGEYGNRNSNRQRLGHKEK
ncbi:MAG TPA: hypothetical protein IAC41_10235 [Candidatus Merdenecus merdavium]|nr:hypothetical protein [Candidatus Merdenecus merdavium]